MAVIGINTLFMIPNKVGGTEVYLRKSLHALEKYDKKNSYVVFCNSENENSFHFTNPNWKKVHCRLNASNRLFRIYYEQLMLPNLVREHRCQVLHSFGYTSIFFRKVCSQVVTVHDANWKDHPEDTSFLSNTLLSYLINKSIKHSQVVVTDSDFSLERLRFHFSQHFQKMKVIWPSIDEFRRNNTSSQISISSAVSSIPKPFCLSVGAFYPHKRVDYLIELWKLFVRDDRYNGERLVYVGKNGLLEKQYKKLLSDIPSVVYFPKVSLSDLRFLYRNAHFGLFPSLYEGFGYPVYEAVSSGSACLVGKKRMYHSSIAPSLEELSFKTEADLELLRKYFTEVKKEAVSNYPVTEKVLAQEILTTYDEAIS